MKGIPDARAPDGLSGDATAPCGESELSSMDKCAYTLRAIDMDTVLADANNLRTNCEAFAAFVSSTYQFIARAKRLSESVKQLVRSRFLAGEWARLAEEASESLGGSSTVRDGSPEPRPANPRAVEEARAAASTLSEHLAAMGFAGQACGISQVEQAGRTIDGAIEKLEQQSGSQAQVGNVLESLRGIRDGFPSHSVCDCAESDDWWDLRGHRVGMFLRRLLCDECNPMRNVWSEIDERVDKFYETAYSVGTPGYELLRLAPRHLERPDTLSELRSSVLP